MSFQNLTSGERKRLQQGILSGAEAAQVSARAARKDDSGGLFGFLGPVLDFVRTYTSPLQLVAETTGDTTITKMALTERLVARGVAAYYTGGISEQAFNLAGRPTSAVGAQLTDSRVGGTVFGVAVGVAGVAGSGDTIFSSAGGVPVQNAAEFLAQAKSLPPPPPGTSELITAIFPPPASPGAPLPQYPDDMRTLVVPYTLATPATLPLLNVGADPYAGAGRGGGGWPGQTSPRTRGALLGLALLIAGVVAIGLTWSRR